ncbi:MAG: DNA mismatch repair endonuclease MutL [Phycisphaerales bacterium]|nr:DNA mismatch repair endonuclease MutL [Phycisphaerales bacterium]
MALPRILQLSAGLINRIAAGEVIERPASVVKELVENALDAGASQITVEIEDGGLSLIRIIDNGCGIESSDLPLAFASHATSKLTSDDDLFRIATMGFRGEALASIGAVAQARIVSRTATSQAAWEIYNRGGAISDPQAAAGNTGTIIEVRNLFYNTPARRKFLRGPGTEFSHISEMVMRLALSWPAVAFKLLHNQRTTLDLPATTTEDRLLAAWPQDFRALHLNVDTRDAEIHLRGIIGLPELARPTAKYQFLYLNGRSIRDKFIIHALREAYRGLTEPGRHPAAVLMIDIPPHDVDVNVHPTKTEVRFRDGGRIHGLVLSTVREKLLGSDLTPHAVARRDQPDDPQRQDMRSRLADFFRQPPATPASPLVETPQADPNSASAPFLINPSIPPPAPTTAAPFNQNHETRYPSLLTRQPGADTFVHAPAITAAPSSSPLTPPGISPLSDSTTGQSVAEKPQSFDGGQQPASRMQNIAATDANVAPPAIQLHNSYLVAQADDGLVIIDQHALHERIMYEELLARISRGPLESQRLLIPQTFPASQRQLDLLEQIQPLLLKLGIEAERFGPSTGAVQAFPTFLQRLEPATFVQELLERGEQELLDLHEEELLHEVLDMMACKAAIKAGDPLSPTEIEALLARRELVERSSNCPHGRPTTLRLSLRDLEKQFKRTGF